MRGKEKRKEFRKIKNIYKMTYIYIYIYIERETGSYENANYLRKYEELRRCIKSHMIHVQKSYIIHVENHI